MRLQILLDDKPAQFAKELYVHEEMTNINITGRVLDTNIRSIQESLWRKKRSFMEHWLGRDVANIVKEYLATEKSACGKGRTWENNGNYSAEERFIKKFTDYINFGPGYIYFE